MLVIIDFIFLSSLFWADTTCAGGYMTRLFPRGPSMWAFPVRLVRCPEKTLPSPSCRIYIWQLCSGSRVWEEAGVQIFNPLIFLESHCFQHSDLQYRDSPCISSSKTIVYCLWKLNLFCRLLQEEGVKSLRGMGKVGVEARELYLLLHLFPPTLLLRPTFTFTSRGTRSTVPALVLRLQVTLGVPPQRACRRLCPPCLLARPSILHRFCSFHLSILTAFVLVGFRKKRSQVYVSNLPALTLKPFLSFHQHVLEAFSTPKWAIQFLS